MLNMLNSANAEFSELSGAELAEFSYAESAELSGAELAEFSDSESNPNL